MLSRLFKRQARADLTALWHRIVAIAREPHWYAQRGAADTLEGRFDVISAVLALVLIRLEGEQDVEHSARLTELFITDMDGQLREAGVGDLVVGKRMGKLMSALGGRIGAYADGLRGDDAMLAGAVRRNITTVDENDEGLRLAEGLRKLATDIERTPLPDMLNGEIGR